MNTTKAVLKQSLTTTVVALNMIPLKMQTTFNSMDPTT
jgi:hypothetical protein